jgi:ATP-dependent Lon protease
MAPSSWTKNRYENTWGQRNIHATAVPKKQMKLAWSPVVAVSGYGGDILSIEVSLSEGSGKVTLTGSLGEVMQESAQAALTYARANARRLGLEPTVFDKTNIHISTFRPGRRRKTAPARDWL